MTKSKLLKVYENLLKEKNMGKIDGICRRTSKKDIKDAIACLECTDERLDWYMYNVELNFPDALEQILLRAKREEGSNRRFYIYRAVQYVLSKDYQERLYF